MALTASTVSRQLRAAGFLPIPRHSRDGLSVSRSHGGRVLVSASFIDDKTSERALAARAAVALTDLGYEVNVSADAPNLIHVSRKAD